MLDHEAAYLALNARLRTVSVATTGTMTLVRTTTGYTRADGGSFVTDGFRSGMELLEAGFPTNGYKTVKEVAAATLTIDGTLTAATSAAGRSLTVGLPETRVWENLRPMRSGAPIDAPTSGRPYVTDEYVPATHEATTFPARTGQVQETGLYIVTWFGLSNRGRADLEACTAAVAALYTPGTVFAAGSDQLRIGVQNGQSVQGAKRTQITPIANGWSYVQISIPFFAQTTNLVAA